MPVTMADVDALMKVIDKDNSGKIDAKELKAALPDLNFDEAVCQAFIDKHDKDGDGTLDREELFEFFKSVLN
ncbi:peflin or Penta-EF hand domain-containing protein 1 [Sparganum proliferum]